MYDELQITRQSREMFSPGIRLEATEPISQVNSGREAGTPKTEPRLH
jgi:hypothetical protein